MKKKIVTLIMAGSLSLGCLAGCSQTQQPASTPEPAPIVQETVEETVEEEIPFEVEEITPEQPEEAEPISEEDKTEEINLTSDEEEFKAQMQAEYERVLEELLEYEGFAEYKEELDKVKITDDLIRGLTEGGITDLDSYWEMISEYADADSISYTGPEDEKYNAMFVITLYFACSPDVETYSDSNVDDTEDVEATSENTIADD